MTNPDGTTVTYIERYDRGRGGDLIGAQGRWATYSFSSPTALRIAEANVASWSDGDSVAITVSSTSDIVVPSISSYGNGHLGYRIENGELIVGYVTDGVATIEITQVVNFTVIVRTADADEAGINVQYFVFDVPA